MHLQIKQLFRHIKPQFLVQKRSFPLIDKSPKQLQLSVSEKEGSPKKRVNPIDAEDLKPPRESPKTQVWHRQINSAMNHEVRSEWRQQGNRYKKQKQKQKKKKLDVNEDQRGSLGRN